MRVSADNKKPDVALADEMGKAGGCFWYGHRPVFVGGFLGSAYNDMKCRDCGVSLFGRKNFILAVWLETAP